MQQNPICAWWHSSGLGSEQKDCEDWLKIVEQQEDAANSPEGRVPAIKFLSLMRPACLWVLSSALVLK